MASMFGFIGAMAKFMVEEQFQNIKHIEKVTNPVFLIHGQKDEIIPHSQSISLYDKIENATEIIIPKEMTHKCFNFEHNIAEPFKKFLEKIKYRTEYYDVTYFNQFMQEQEKKRRERPKTSSNLTS